MPIRTTLAAALLAISAGHAIADVAIVVDKDTQSMDVSVDGEHLYTWPVSTGKAGHDTPAGSYRPMRMEADHRSKEWDDAPMPNSIFFTDKGHAIHGSGHVRGLGSPASHGCVRLAPRNAAILYEVVKAEGMGRTRVTIAGAPVAAAPAVASVTRPARRVVVTRTAPTVRYGDDDTPVYAGPRDYVQDRGYGGYPAYRESYRSYPSYGEYRRRLGYADGGY